MSFHQKNVMVTFISFSLILLFLIVRIGWLVQTDSFTDSKVFWVWGIVIVLATVVTVIGMIMTHMVSALKETIEHGEADESIDDTKDERDERIDMQGTKITYTISSVGVALAMLTYVLGHPPLVLFTALIFVGVISQVVGDATRLAMYRSGF